MKINSSYYNYYYNPMISTSDALAISSNTEDSDSTQSSTIKSITPRSIYPSINSGLNEMSLNSTPQRLMRLFQMSNDVSTETSESIEKDKYDNQQIQYISKFKDDLDNIKNIDIDSLTSDEVKELLENIISDVSSIPNPYRTSSSSQKMNIDSMSEEDMREVLKKIQTQINTTYGKPMELSDRFKKINDDLVNIKAADVDSLSSEAAKELLSELKNDMSAVSKPEDEENSLVNVDVDSMSDLEIRNILKTIQKQIDSMPEMEDYDNTTDYSESATA